MFSKMFSNKKNIKPILKHTPYVGSADSKIIHSTENPCPDTYMIDPELRWYIRSIPEKSGYIKCKKCFPQDKEEKKDD